LNALIPLSLRDKGAWSQRTRTIFMTRPIMKFSRRSSDCDECVRHLRGPLIRIQGVKDVLADPETERVWVMFDARKTHTPDVHDAILKSGYKPAATAD
jgi:hypothetical protein